jgi:hypothetical protein
MAFPTTVILDTFNRADENPATGWTSILSNWQVTTNVANPLAAQVLATFGTTDYGADSEAHATIATKPATALSCGVMVRVKDTGSVVTVDGYTLGPSVAAGTDTIAIQRIDNGVGTTLGSTVSQEITNGDGIGLQVIGSNLEGFYRSGAGAWASIGSRTDATYGAVGRIGMVSTSTATRMDDFGGGTYIPTGMRLSRGLKLEKMSLVN